MSKAEAFEVNFGENKSIGVNVNFSKGDAIQVPVSINSLDAEKFAKEVGDRIAEKLDETYLASVAKEQTLLIESQRIQDEVRNIDLSSVENKVEEIKQAVENIDLSPIENKVDEGVSTLSTKIDNIDLSYVAKQGENQEATNTKILEEVSKIAVVDADILQGKRKVASAITVKGIDADYKESLNDLSTKISQIPQKQYISIGDDKYYYPQPYMQSIFKVAEDLKKSDMPDYIPAYMKEYKQMFCVNQFVIVDYYQSSIVAETANGMLTSDGHFYTKALSTITHTFPNGETERYESDTIEHTFSDSEYINNWCAYFFTKEEYIFSGTQDGLMNIIVCGNCGYLDIAKYNSVYIDGIVVKIDNSVESSTTGVTLVNYITHNNGGSVIKKDLSCKYVNIPDLEEISNNSTIVNYLRADKYVPQYFQLPKGGELILLCCPSLKRVISGGSVFRSDMFAASYTNAIGLKLKEISLNELELVDSTSYIFYGTNDASNARQRAFDGVERIYLPKLKECTTLFKAWYNSQKEIFWWFINLKSIELPSLLNIPATMFSAPIEAYDTITGTSKGYSLIELLDYSSAISIGNNLGGICASHTTMSNLIDFRVGALEKSINTQYWTATNVIADETKKAQLQQNIHNHIAERVSDRTGLSALTFTFSQEVRNVLLPETEALFAAKNWNIAPTRTA